MRPDFTITITILSSLHYFFLAIYQDWLDCDSHSGISVIISISTTTSPYYLGSTSRITLEFQIQSRCCHVYHHISLGQSLILPAPTAMQTSHKSDYPDQSSEDQHGTFAGPSPRETIAQSTAGKPSPRDDYKTCFTSLTISPDETAVTKSRSHANLQTLMHGRSIRKTMENLNLSLGVYNMPETMYRVDKPY